MQDKNMNCLGIVGDRGRKTVCTYLFSFIIGRVLMF